MAIVFPPLMFFYFKQAPMFMIDLLPDLLVFSCFIKVKETRLGHATFQQRVVLSKICKYWLKVIAEEGQKGFKREKVRNIMIN